VNRIRLAIILANQMTMQLLKQRTDTSNVMYTTPACRVDLQSLQLTTPCGTPTERAGHMQRGRRNGAPRVRGF
jgi:hypothetical protein